MILPFSLRFPVQLVQCFAEAFCLLFRKLQKQPFIKNRFNFCFGIFQSFCFFRSIQKLASAVPRIRFPDQISLCLKACSASCSGSFINLLLFAHFRLRDARMMAHQMDKVKFCCADALFFHCLNRKFPGFPRYFCYFPFCWIHFSVPPVHSRSVSNRCIYN